MHKNYLKFLLFFTILWLPLWGFAREVTHEMLYKEILANRHHTKLALQKSLEIVELAKLDDDKEHLFDGYELLTRFAENHQKQRYGDSLIFLATQMRDEKRIGVAYISNSELQMDLGNYHSALDYTLVALDYFEALKDEEYIYAAKYNIGYIKSYLKDYKDAEKHLQQSLAFFEKKIDNSDDSANEYYIYNLISLIDVQAKQKKYKSASALIEKGFAFVKRNKNFAIYRPYFVTSEGINLYYQKKYKEAKDKLKQSLATYKEDYEHLDVLFYLGMSHWHLGEKDQAVKHLKAIEQEYEKTQQLHSELRPAIEHLMLYYKEKNDQNHQLYYAEKLVEIDEKIQHNQLQANSTMVKKHNQHNTTTPKTEQESSLLRFAPYLAGLGILALLGIFAIRKLSAKPNNPKTNPETEPEIDETDYSAYSPISPNTAKRILARLSDFENKKQFTNKNLKANNLANILGTNEKYLLKIIKVSRGKSFSDYITALRLDYLAELQAENQELINEKTPSEIAEIIGFPDEDTFIEEQEKYPPKFTE